jgi:PAS domain S-box-containing protein
MVPVLYSLRPFRRPDHERPEEIDVMEKTPSSMADELAALRAELIRKDEIINRIPAMIGYWNRELRCEFANEAYVEWFGISPLSAVGMHLSDLLGEKLFRLNEPYARAALAGKEQRFEREISKPDGSVGYTDARYIPDADDSGNIRGFAVLVSDVTELHQAYERIRELAQRLEAAREQERRSLAQVLHEGVAQDLFALKLALDHLHAQAAGRTGVTDAYQELAATIEKCISDMRQIANDLRPDALKHMRVSVAIEEHARYFGATARLQIHVEEVAPLPELDEALRLFLFRAAQEALTNVARHAKASRVAITLRTDGSNLILEVVDDGIGFAEGALEKPGSLGLLGLRERAQALGGELSIGTPASGALVSVRVPLQ